MYSSTQWTGYSQTTSSKCEHCESRKNLSDVNVTSKWDFCIECLNRSKNSSCVSLKHDCSCACSVVQQHAFFCTMNRTILQKSGKFVVVKSVTEKWSLCRTWKKMFNQGCMVCVGIAQCVQCKVTRSRRFMHWRSKVARAWNLDILKYECSCACSVVQHVLCTLNRTWQQLQEIKFGLLLPTCVTGSECISPFAKDLGCDVTCLSGQCVYRTGVVRCFCVQCEMFVLQL